MNVRARTAEPAQEPPTPRPFRVLGVAQVAIGGADRHALRKLWVDLLGLHPVHTFQSERENVDEETLLAGAGPLAVEVDLMQPLDPLRSPRVDKPPLNHVGLWVDDLLSAASWLAEQGVRLAPGGIRKGAMGHDVCFVHPKHNDEFPLSGMGVLLELIQAPPEVVAAHDLANKRSTTA